NRDFYTKTDPKSVETREKFVEYVTNMFKLLGDDAGAAQSNAATVMKIQTALAEASLTPVELRNPDNRYNKVTVDAAIAAMPDFSLAEYMSARSVPKVPDMNFAQPKFFGAVNSMAKSVSLGDWKTYLRWMTVNAAAQFLPK
ncbi:MAG TPA: M13 family peptidase, partial [Blastocatellia bacterium]|nr:M13 family peptidase [Blastocatellia bacterium]